MNPEDVTTPLNALRNLRVIHNDGDWSVATYEYCLDGSWSERVGIRWNGEGGTSAFPKVPATLLGSIYRKI